MLIQLAAPTDEPVTLQEARLHLRADDDVTVEDAMITSLIAAARQECEAITQRSLITQSWRLVLDAFPPLIELERGTVQAVTAITYLGADGVWATLAPTEYVADLSGCPARITPVFGKVWPVTQPQIGSVKIDYTAGYGATAASVPAGIKSWIKLRIGSLYHNREEVALAQRGKLEMLPYVEGMLDAFRVVRY